jgi:hypothetical protein
MDEPEDDDPDNSDGPPVPWLHTFRPTYATIPAEGDGRSSDDPLPAVEEDKSHKGNTSRSQKESKPKKGTTKAVDRAVSHKEGTKRKNGNGKGKGKRKGKGKGKKERVESDSEEEEEEEESFIVTSPPEYDGSQYDTDSSGSDLKDDYSLSAPSYSIISLTMCIQYYLLLPAARVHASATYPSPSLVLHWSRRWSTKGTTLTMMTQSAKMGQSTNAQRLKHVTKRGRTSVRRTCTRRGRGRGRG